MCPVFTIQGSDYLEIFVEYLLRKNTKLLGHLPFSLSQEFLRTAGIWSHEPIGQQVLDCSIHLSAVAVERRDQFRLRSLLNQFHINHEM